MQELIALAPRMAPDFPVGQMVQVDAAVELAYRPIGQRTQAEEPGDEKYPVGQLIHTERSLAPMTVEYFPAGHFKGQERVDTPVSEDAVPAGHRIQPP